jgi:hypothetical protein
MIDIRVASYKRHQAGITKMRKALDNVWP